MARNGRMTIMGVIQHFAIDRFNQPVAVQLGITIDRFTSLGEDSLKVIANKSTVPIHRAHNASLLDFLQIETLVAAKGLKGQDMQYEFCSAGQWNQRVVDRNSFYSRISESNYRLR